MSGNPVGRPPSRISVRTSKALKEQLDQQAKAEGLNLSQYLTKHYEQLVGEGKISPDVDIEIANPGTNPYISNPSFALPYAPNPSQPYYQQPYYYPPPTAQFATQPVPPDQMDLFMAEIRKLLLTQMMSKMLMEMQRGGGSSYDDLLRLWQTGAAPGASKKEDFTMADMMKWQFQMNMMEQQQQKGMQQAQLALETARAKGDKGGESKALEMIVALSTAAAQQNQNFMTQFMTAMQMNQNTQQTLYTTALGSNKASEESARQDRNAMTMQIQGVQTQMMQNQIASVQQMGTMQVEYLKADLERIRTNPVKDPLTQLIELDKLSKDSPVMSAAMKAAFGGGGGISEWIPQLKALGIGPFLDKIIGGLTGLVTPRPQTLPEPAAIPLEIPTPMAAPTPAQLAALHLPGAQPQQTSPETEKPQGYTNMNPPENPAATKTEPNLSAGYSNLTETQPPATAKQKQEPTVTQENENKQSENIQP